MNKAFTLFELVVVIIILGVLATLGLTQYGRMVERARGTEARAILGDIRKLAAGYWLENGTVTGFGVANANIGTAADQIPYDCRSSHYFRYMLDWDKSGNLVITATRCTTGGKGPQGISSNTLLLTVYFGTGNDTWGGNGNY